MSSLDHERRDRLIKERIHDPYMQRVKSKDPMVCPECGASYIEGRWTWKKPDHVASRDLCPACQRIEDKVPAGLLTLKGSFVTTHWDEIENLIRNTEEREKEYHPLKKLMSIDKESKDTFVVKTTEFTLARNILTDLESAYEGSITFHYGTTDPMFRGEWLRN